MLNAVFIFFGLSLDSFIVMMKKGASLRRLTYADILLYSLIYAVISAGMFMAGYLISLAVGSVLPDGRIEILTAAVLINIIGVYVVVKAFLSDRFEEKLDRQFNLRALVRLALITNLDTLIVGIGFSLFGISTLQALSLALIISFAVVFAALVIGENLGVGYQRVIGLAGGSLMIIFSLLVFIRYMMR